MPRKKSDKPKREKPDPVPPPAPSAPRVRLPWGQFARVAAGLLIAVGLVVGIAWVGERAGRELVGEERYAVRFADIDCPTPANSSARSGTPSGSPTSTARLRPAAIARRS